MGDEDNRQPNLTIDGVEQAAYMIDSEVDPITGIPTGREVRRQSLHLLTAPDYSPFKWPVLDCGSRYLMVLETNSGYGIPYFGEIEIYLAGRE